jgi:hypothetical protein
MGRDRCVGGRCVLRRAGGGVRWSISWTDDAVEERCEDTYGAVSGRFPRIGSAIVTVLLLIQTTMGKRGKGEGFGEMEKRRGESGGTLPLERC